MAYLYRKKRSPFWYVQYLDSDRKKHDKSTGLRAHDPNVWARRSHDHLGAIPRDRRSLSLCPWLAKSCRDHKTRPKQSAWAGRMQCVNNNHQLGLAWALYVEDNRDTYPITTSWGDFGGQKGKPTPITLWLGDTRARRPCHYRLKTRLPVPNATHTPLRVEKGEDLLRLGSGCIKMRPSAPASLMFNPHFGRETNRGTHGLNG